MRRVAKRGIALPAAVLSLLLAAASASAYDMTIAPAGAITAESSALSFSDSNRIINVVCPVTFGGSLDSGPIQIASGNQFGLIDGVSVGTCSGGSAVGLVNSGWELTVNSVLGTAPNGLTGILFNIENYSKQYTIRVLGLTIVCLYRGTALGLMSVTGSNPYRTTSGTFLGNLIPKFSGHSACPPNARPTGALSFIPAQTITVT
jgi:hypothetical protein